MRDRLASLGLVLNVQRLHRSQAEAAMAEAREARASADAAAAAAAALTDEAGSDWQDHVAGPGYDPSYGPWLASRLIGRVEEQAQAEQKARLSSQLADRRQVEWQALEAQVRFNEQGAQRLGRAMAHAWEEKRLHALADRTTYLWMKT